ncbi:hypothetical protein [Gemmatimonas sp.]|uniref:hypothetical protein n=1 Tax=Gemmatimonas sp. TaxID=1962908 RepID=UPI00286DCA86|nr:hypothetical protein [Gemmatimonas sp.]
MSAMLVITMAPAQAQSGKRVPSVTGCWQASRPLGPTGGALSVPRDAPFTTIVLRDSGRVVLPRLNDRERVMWEARSYWEAHRDSVEVQVFTGLQGWRAELSARRLPVAMQGTATYLTDVLVANAAPLQVAVTLSRTPCQADWATLPITTRIPRSWERGKQPYLEFQVERPAALAAGVKLPKGVRSMRALGRHENSDARTDRPEVVVVQFIVESDGRADTSSLKLLYADGARASARARDAVAEILASVRFTPPMVGGKAVNQLATWRIERFGK